jgi:hypothetical protein
MLDLAVEYIKDLQEQVQVLENYYIPLHIWCTKETHWIIEFDRMRVTRYGIEMSRKVTRICP